ncbi:MAG: hydroxyphenylacetyl-CoA thioesterase PaaI [Ignavibacteriales bacterium]
MNKQKLAETAVAQMLIHDGFSAWLGIELLEIKPGRTLLKMKVRKEMLNGFNICHGGILFALADSAMAFAANTHGQLSVSIENGITYLEKVTEGDVITAGAEEVYRSDKIAVYNVSLTKQDNIRVALFRGTVYRTKKTFPEETAG